MDLIYQSDYKKTFYDDKLSLITNIWTDKDMNDEIFQEEISIWVELIEAYRPKNLIADTQLFVFTIGLEMQEWTSQKVFPRIVSSGVKKFAVIVSQELIAQLSIEQTMEEVNPDVLQNRYFASIEEAKQWFTE